MGPETIHVSKLVSSYVFPTILAIPESHTFHPITLSSNSNILINYLPHHKFFPFFLYHFTKLPHIPPPPQPMSNQLCPPLNNCPPFKTFPPGNPFPHRQPYIFHPSIHPIILIKDTGSLTVSIKSKHFTNCKLTLSFECCCLMLGCKHTLCKTKCIFASAPLQCRCKTSSNLAKLSKTHQDTIFLTCSSHSFTAFTKNLSSFRITAFSTHKLRCKTKFFKKPLAKLSK